MTVRETSLDPRCHAYRDDLAAADLQGLVTAARFVPGLARQVASELVGLRKEPRADAELCTEALFGERLTVFDERDGWAWVQLARDRYVGYVPSAALSSVMFAASHRVVVPRTFVFPAANIKTPPIMALGRNAEIAVRGTSGRFVELQSGGFVYTAHTAPLAERASDFVTVALSFLHVPYLWGGRTWLGLDCSGLVQVALEAAGRVCPRDSDMQAAELGEPLADIDILEDLRRGDLVFWPGHVGIMVDSDQLIHANAHAMMVAIEPLIEANARSEKAGAAITVVRRL